MKIMAVIIIVLLAGGYLFRSPPYPNSFKAADETDKIQYKLKQDFSGAALVNLDGEDDLEIFISVYGADNLVLKYTGGVYRPIAIAELVDPHGMTFSATACDVDKDGRDELLLLNHPNLEMTSKSKVLKFRHGKWVEFLVDPEQLKFGYSATCIDRKGDGTYGFAVANGEGEILYLELVDGKIIDVAKDIGLGVSSKGRSILGVPGAHGKMNIFVGNEKGSNFFFVNNGDGTFKESAEAAGLSDSSFDARGISIIDNNHDDLPDIIYGNHYGPIRLMNQTREGMFVDATPEIFNGSYAVNSAVVGDFNLDGYEDIYLNNIRGDNEMFGRFENAWFKLDLKLMSEKSMYGISTIAADLDGNGSYEILNTHGDGSRFPITLYSIASEHPWMKFSIRYESGSVPRGAVVLLKTNVRDQMRVISSGSGRFANYENDLTFGFLKDEKVNSVEVILPSGKKLSFKEEFKMMATNKLTLSLD